MIIDAIREISEDFRNKITLEEAMTMYDKVGISIVIRDGRVKGTVKE